MVVDESSAWRGFPEGDPRFCSARENPCLPIRHRSDGSARIRPESAGERNEAKSREWAPWRLAHVFPLKIRDFSWFCAVFRLWHGRCFPVGMRNTNNRSDAMNATTCPMTPDFDTLQAYLVDQVWSGAGGDSARQAVAGPVLQACQILERRALRRWGLSYTHEGEIAARLALRVLNGPGRKDGLGRYNPTKPLQKFVATIAHRRAIDIVRGMARQQEIREEISRSLKPSKPPVDPHHEWALLAICVEKYIRMQADPYSAKSLVAGFIRDYLMEYHAWPTYKEIAAGCDMEPGYARCLRTEVIRKIEAIARSMPPET